MSEVGPSDVFIDLNIVSDELEVLCGRGDQIPVGFQTVKLAEPWTCPEDGWYVYANGTFVKVGDP